MCFCGNCPNCGCKCGCWGSCSNGNCFDNACCTCPPPTCGCGEPLAEGETCLNQPYYLVATNTETGQQVYFQFNFEYVILTTLTGTTFSSPLDCISQWIAIYYQLDTGNWFVGDYITYNFPTGIPAATETGAGSPITGYGYATNSFLWAIDVNYYSPDPFTPYGTCNSQYPQGVYPSSSTPY